MSDKSAELSQLSQSIDETAGQLNSLQHLTDNQNSINNLRKSLALLYNNRGFLYYKAIEFNLAADDYTDAIKLDPKFAIAYYNRATIHYRMSSIINHFDKAFDDLKIAIELDPNNPEFRLAFEQSWEQLNTNCINS